jgi:hypothetical protein
MLMAVCVLFAAHLSAVDQEANARPDLATIVQRIWDTQLENHARVKAYAVTREYKVFGAGASSPRTDVVATVNFLPPDIKSYDIEKSTGGMGEKVIRHILDHEVDAARNSRLVMVDNENYEFEFSGEDSIAGRRCFVLKITPRHDRKELLRARIWVDANSYHLLRMEGEPAKSPSFWVKDIHVVLNFGEVSGMWLQTETNAFARLRFGGEYNIISHDLNYDVGQTVAAKLRPTGRTPRHSPTIMAASFR